MPIRRDWMNNLIDPNAIEDPIGDEDDPDDYLWTLKLGLEGIAAREAVNNPSHYNQGNIEVIDAIEYWGLDFNSGNVVKYVARHQHKAEALEDLKKARWYLDRIIEGYEDGS